ncbi:Aconitase/3-isopropylmalate dehydratase [Xylaria longipes]|nr:Aconitase/3-isopropylmalate dehydratase [Xylaria longipes]
MAEVCMENYDPEFTKLTKPSDVLVTSFNFGCSIGLSRLVERLRESFKDDTEQPLTHRTGWKLLWDVRRSKTVITEKDGTIWEQKVSELPPSVQEMISVKSQEN